MQSRLAGRLFKLNFIKLFMKLRTRKLIWLTISELFLIMGAVMFGTTIIKVGIVWWHSLIIIMLAVWMRVKAGEKDI